jgi:Glycosyl hydrolase family 76
MWHAHAADAWSALVRDALPRRSGRQRVLDGPEGREASLWPLVHVLWAAADLRLLGDEVPIAPLRGVLERFRRGDAYAATPRERSRYFDDNAWLGLAALRLQEATGDDTWRELAQRTAAFVATGEHPDGGIRWREGSDSRNTCSTASAAWLQATASVPDGAAHATRWIDWLDATLERPDGLFADRIDRGELDPRAWTYNQGAVVAARTAVGRDPGGLVGAVRRRWDPDRLWREPAAFLVIAARAMLEIPEERVVTIAWLDPHLNRLAADARDPRTGWYVRGNVGSYDGRPTIDQAAIVQLFALRART